MSMLELSLLYAMAPVFITIIIDQSDPAMNVHNIPVFHDLLCE